MLGADGIRDDRGLSRVSAENARQRRKRVGRPKTRGSAGSALAEQTLNFSVLLREPGRLPHTTMNLSEWVARACPVATWLGYVRRV